MFSALILFCSADRSGVTSSMCHSALRSLEDRGYNVTIRTVSDLRIEHCRDCGGCDHRDCVIRDDMDSIYLDFAKADLVIFATPIHFSGPSSIMKTVMDRFQPYWTDRERAHPRYCALMMCGGSSRPNFDPTETIVRAFSATIGMRYLGSLQITDTDRGTSDIGEETEGFVKRIIEDKG